MIEMMKKLDVDDDDDRDCDDDLHDDNGEVDDYHGRQYQNDDLNINLTLTISCINFFVIN